jgi:hypothetical protein
MAFADLGNLLGPHEHAFGLCSLVGLGLPES